MRIKHLDVDGIRSLPDGRLSFATSTGAADTVAITGPLGSGKTTVLDAIVAAKESVGSYGSPPDPRPLIRRGLDAAKIRATWELAESERAQFGLGETALTSEMRIGGDIAGPPHEPALEALLSTYEADSAHGKVEYFYDDRRLPIGAAVDLSTSPGDSFDRMMRLGRDEQKYAGLVRYIVESGLGMHVDENGEPAPGGRVTNAFATLCESKRLAGLYHAGNSILPGFVDDADRTYGLAELSSSERERLLFAATWVRAGLVSNEPGSVVLIDTPERSLGDEGAGDLVRGLSELGPNNQLVIATTSRSVAETCTVVVRLGGSA